MNFKITTLTMSILTVAAQCTSRGSYFRKFDYEHEFVGIQICRKERYTQINSHEYEYMSNVMLEGS